MSDEVNQRRSRNRDLTPWADIEAAAPILPAPSAPSGGDNQFGEWDLGDRPSRAKGAPLDHNGMEFMSNHEVGNIFGIGPNNSKRVSYSAIPQFIEHKGQGGAKDTTRTWFSKEHVVNHLASLLKSGKTKEEKAAAQARWGGFHKKLSAELEEGRASFQERRDNGEDPGHLFNQTNPGHKDIHLRMEISHNGRVQPLSSTGKTKFSSSLGGARASGNLTPVGEGPDLPKPKRGRVRP